MLMRGFEGRDVVGLDVETIHGKPYTIQLWSPKRSYFQVFKRPADITRWMIETSHDFDTGTVFYAHNLAHDLYMVFYRWRSAFVHSHFRLTGPALDIEIFYGNVCFATMRVGARVYYFVDSFAFFKTSLKALAEMFHLTAKAPKPRKLGQVVYHGKAFQAFKRYAMIDARISHGVGCEIEAFHRGLDVPQAISAPQLSARVFRKRFIPEGRSIPIPPRRCMEAAQLSYHGGKNGLYVAPGVYHGVRLYDITSAYPFAYTQLPNFLECKYVWEGRSYPFVGQKKVSRTYRRVVPGIYCISGRAKADPYNILRTHKFERVEGYFSEIWVTSYELETILRHGFVEDLECSESWMVQESRESVNPLRNFARHFFTRKQETIGVMREFYKVTLNSLYGKFIQATRDNDVDFIVNEEDAIETAPHEYMAGGLYNPMVATLITGFVRAYLTEAEIKTHALHSSTDSIVTRRSMLENKQLGGWSLQAQGSGVFIRPKLYVMWNFKRQVTHFALHGFHGSLSQFLSLLRSGKRVYAHNRMLKVRESAIQKKTPWTMTKMWKVVNLPIKGALDIPKLTHQGRVV